MDTVRANFFWQGASESYKYHMVRWRNMCLPKEFGGVGILETRTMNEALLGKWGWRMLQSKQGDLCAEFLQRKYLKKSGLLQCSESGCSQFWKGILKTKEILKWGLKAHVKNGQKTRFWEDVWIREIPLKLEYPRLYALCKDKGCLVADYWENDGWKIEFNRPLGERDMSDWESLICILDDIPLREGDDQFTWVLEKSGAYTTRSMYRRLLFRGVNNRRMKKLCGRVSYHKN